MRTGLKRGMAAVTTRLRSCRDLTAYLVQHEWVFAMAVTTVLLGWLPSAPFEWTRQFGWGVAIVGTALSLWLLWRDTHALFNRFSSWEFEAAIPAFLPSQVITDEYLPLRVNMGRGSIFTSPEVNQMLAMSPELIWRTDSFRLEGELREHAASLVRQSTSARRVFNGPCVRLEDDLSEEALRRREPAIMRPARYFDALCSNQLTKWNITRDGSPWTFRDTYLFQRTDSAVRRIQPLSRSTLANIVGVSTLAITRDDHLLVVLQSRNSGSSARLRAPSGSGSLEPRDIGEPPLLLGEVVIRGAVRELREECAVAESDILGSMVIGYGRWLEHGAKPEFVVLTALDLDAEDIQRRPAWRSGEEATWTQSVKAVPLVLSGATDALSYTTEGSVAAELTGDPGMAGSASIPLEFGMRCLAAALGQDPSILTSLRSRTPRIRRTA